LASLSLLFAKWFHNHELFRRYRNLLGIDVCAKSQRKYTALIRAAENGHTACVRLLLDAGANKEAPSYVR
jgi:ankyrin repeat protein